MYYVYRITNKINSKTYIGQHKYKKLDDNYMGSGKLIRRAQKKYGIENFEKEILYSRIQYKTTADDMEKFAIAKERAIGKAEYNIADGGQGGTLRRGKTPWNKGKCHSSETKRKISEAKKGKQAWNKGKPISDEQRMKISETLKGHIAWNKGIHRSEETKRKISEARKGRPSSMKGKHRSEEAKIKQSEAMKGRQSWKKGLKLGPNGTHWYNNGKVNVKAKECPEGFVKGRLYIW